MTFLSTAVSVAMFEKLLGEWWRSACSAGLPALLIAGRERRSRTPPFRLDVVLLPDVALTEVIDHRPVAEALEIGRAPAPYVRVHERHVPVREAGHRAGHADAADVG